MASRRHFLSFLVAAPAAIPVIAKEAARKLGLEGALGGTLGPHTLPGYGVPGVAAGGHWAHDAIKRFWSPRRQRERRETIEGAARRLDADLASMRSLSPSAAYRIQYDRTKTRIETQNWDYLQEHLAEAVKDKLGA